LNSDIQFLREQWNIFRISYGASGLSSWTSTLRWETVRFFINKMLETTKYAHLFVLYQHSQMETVLFCPDQSLSF
jgi:hypothetical protein